MTDRELYELLEQNPEAGVHHLLRIYGGAIKTICRNFLYDCTEEDIEEAIADTVIHFWRGRHHFVPNEKHSLKSYLYAIARNAARDKRKSLKKVSIFPLEEVAMELSSEENIEKDFERKEQERLLHQCIADMDEPDRRVFLYRYFYGFKNSEIADMLSLLPKKVENILYRGKRRLHKTLTERGISYEQDK